MTTRAAILDVLSSIAPWATNCRSKGMDELIGEFWTGVIAAIGAFAFLYAVWRIVRREFSGNWIGL